MNTSLSLDFIGIGVPKAATSWLYFCLKEHPEICISEKEIDFFNATSPFPEEAKGNYKKGISWYASHFNHCSKENIIGEYSVNYFADPKAAKRIANHFPDIKIIVILRNPVDRAYSHYQYQKVKARDAGPSKKAQKMDFEAFLGSEETFKRVGFYDEHLKRWLSLFDKDQMLIWLYDDIQTRPQEVVRDTYRFLSVDHSFIPPSLQKQINTTKEKKRLSFGNSLLSLITKAGYSFYDYFISHEEESGYPKLDPEVRKRVRNIYLPHIQKTEKLVEKDMSIWYQQNS